MADLDADDDEVGGLYADLDDQVRAALAAAGESGRSSAKDSDPITDEEKEGDANAGLDLSDEVMDYSSDSEDDLRIVLNEEAGREPPPPPSPARRDEAEVGEEEEEDLGDRAVSSAANDGLRSKDCF